MKIKFILSLLLFQSIISLAQRPPWESPLLKATSTDGITFNNIQVFQDSAGVPCVIRWKNDTLISVFQWFRQPINSATWDKVAVKYSYDNGKNWTTPLPISIPNFPSGYQRPFDPSIVNINRDSLRIYFSSSRKMPGLGEDSIINTYSAVSTDGINFSFENFACVDVDTSRVIDPSVIKFKGTWHYLAPAGAPQQGAFHYISPNGTKFNRVLMIPSDNQHNWTGNYMVNDTGELRFYGCGAAIWYNSSPNGGLWNGYIHTNLKGGDPSVVKINDSLYHIIYVGAPYSTSLKQINETTFNFFPNPANQIINFQTDLSIDNIVITDITGHQIEITPHHHQLDVSSFANGIYFISFRSNEVYITKKISIQHD